MTDQSYPLHGGDSYKDGYLGFPDYPPEFLAENHPSGFMSIINYNSKDDPISKAVIHAREKYHDEIKRVTIKIENRLKGIKNETRYFHNYKLVLNWFVYWANKHGPEVAFTGLNSLTTKDTVRIRISSDLVGINYQCDGIKIETENGTLEIDSVLKNPDHHTLSNFILYPNPDMSLGYYPTHAVSLVKEISFEELVSQVGTQHHISNMSLQNDLNLLNAFCMSATLNGYGQVSPDYTKWTLDELPYSGAFRLGICCAQHGVSRVRGDGFDVEKRNIPKIEADIVSILTLDKPRKDRFTLALRQLSLSKGEASIEEQYLYSASALEIILGAQKDQIAFSVRLFGSMIAASDYDERVKIYKNLKVLYGVRSSVVHNGKVDSKKLRDEPNPSKLSSEIIRKYLELGMPDIEDFILRCQKP